MRKLFKLISLVLILAISFSCVQKESTEKGTSKLETVSISKTDTLKFTSGIRAIFQDSKGNYWFGSHREGVGLFNGESYQYFTTDEGLFDNQIRSIQEDKNGNIWFGTANGVCSYDGRKITKHTPITDDYLQIEWQKTGDYLWFNAGNNAGIYRYDGQKLNYLAFPISNNESIKNSYGITGISKDQDAKVWIATYAALFNFDGEAIQLFDQTKLALKETDILHIRSVLADSQGRIWVGNNGIGVLLIQGDATINFSEKNNLIHPTSSRRGDKSPAGTLEHVFVIEEDSDGNIWFGDRDTGVWKYDGKNMTNYTINANLTTSMIWSIYSDKNNNLLLGMADGGVYKFNGTSFDKTF